MNIYDQITRNKRRSFVLVISLMGLMAVLAYIIGLVWDLNALGLAGIALIATGLYSWFSYRFSDKIVLGISHARQVNKQEAPDLYRLVENLCLGEGLPMPKVYIIDDSAMNAFATGRDPAHASVAFTTGILNRLERAELEGVIAHELSHVKNYDIRMTSLVVVLVGVIALVADVFLRMSLFSGSSDDDGDRHPLISVVAILLALLTPIVAQIIQLAISRQREYLADASGALLTRYPEGLARALEKISVDKEPLEVANNATASLYFANPLKAGATSWFSGLFNTHPPIEERIKRLRNM